MDMVKGIYIEAMIECLVLRDVRLKWYLLQTIWLSFFFSKNRKMIKYLLTF